MQVHGPTLEVVQTKGGTKCGWRPDMATNVFLPATYKLGDNVSNI